MSRNSGKEYVIDYEHQYEMLKKIKAGDEAAYNDFVRENFPLVMSRIKNFCEYKSYLNVFISYGNEGLIQAINKFDFEKNVKFSTYAVIWIDSLLHYAAKFIKKQKRISTVSFDELCEVNKLEENIDTIFYLEEQSKNDDLFTEIDMKETVEKFLKDVPERVQEMIKLHYGFYNNKCYAFREIGKMYGLSGNRVWELVTKYVRKMSNVAHKNIMKEQTKIN